MKTNYLRLAACCVAILLGLGALLVVRGQNPEAGAGATVVLGERQPPALSSGLGIDILGIPTGNSVPPLPAPDIDANRYGPGIFVGFGQVVYDQVDMGIQGRDPATTLVIARRHISRRDQTNSIFGPAWAFNYRHTIIRDANTNIVMESFGRKDFFVNRTNAWEGTEGRFDRLTYTAGKYTLRMPHGTVLEFTADDTATEKPAHLTKITSPNGNTLLFTYDTAETNLLKQRLFSITESFGRAITFSYGSGSSSQWVTNIADFSGRNVAYTYNSDGQLLSVRSPIVTNTVSLNDFRDGKTFKYAYRNHEDPRLKNALLSVVFPNQVTNDLARFQWAYRDRDVADPFFGYVTNYTCGNTIASADLKAGGTFSYAYKTFSEIKSDLNEPAWEIEVTDRRGTKTDYRVNRLGHVLLEAISNQFRGGTTKWYQKSFKYNADGQLTNRFAPLGGKTDYVYGNRRDLDYNKNRKIPRNSEINLTSTLRFPDEREAQQAVIREDVVYEPIFNQPFKVTSPRGFDVKERLAGELPKDLPQRFITSFYRDYMEDLAGVQAQFAPLLGLTSTDLQGLFGNAGIVDLAADVNGDNVRSQRSGNIIKIAYPPARRPKSAAGENLASRVGLTNEVEQAEELFRYNQFGQVVYQRDAEQNVTVTSYYPTNNPSGPLDQNANVNASGGGYLESVLRDAEAGAGRNSDTNLTPALALKTRYEYTSQEYKAPELFPANPRGVPTAVIDPRGIKTKYLVNELDQIVKTVEAADVSASTETNLTAFAYESIFIYDSNNNVVEARVQNKDTIDNDNDFIVRKDAYDILDQKTVEILDQGHLAITNAYTFDPSQNLTDTEQGKGATNAVKTHLTLDERDIEISLTRGFGSPEASTNYTGIDANGNVTQRIDAAPPTDGSSTKPDKTVYQFDGFDREIAVIDRVGNKKTIAYNSASLATTEQAFGPVDHSVTKPILLAQTDIRYDERNRAYRTDKLLRHYPGKEIGAIDDGVLDPDDEKVSNIVLYDRSGRTVGTVDAEDNTSQIRYDGLSRAVATIDALNNEVHNAYDLNNNLVQALEIEKSPLISTNEMFTNTYTYDALNRQVKVREPNGQTTTFGYDSRSNLNRTTDQLGNVTEYVFDGLNRETEKRTYLSMVGTNASAATKDTNQCGDGIITRRQGWDALSRLVSQTDDKTNTTQYIYDRLHRKVQQVYANGTSESRNYNRDSELLTHTSQNGSIEAYKYDSESRVKELTITHPAGLEVGGTTKKTWGYDGLGRTTLATDNNGAGDDDDVTCTYVYDTLSRQLRETQKIGALPELAIDSEWQAAIHKVSSTYPNGRKVKRFYDALDRLSLISEGADSSLIARFEYVGPSRDVRTTYGNGAVLDKRNSAGTQTTSGANSGYDFDRRHVRQEWKKGSQSIVAYGNTYNGLNGIGTNRKASETREHLSNHTDTYQFDSDYRMIGFRRNGTGSGTGGTLSERTLDGDDVAVTLAEDSRSIDIDLGAADDESAEMNEYESFDGKTRTYDKDSSLDSDGNFKYIQDYQNRIVEIRRPENNSFVAHYTYDVNNRRVLRDVGGTKTRYLYDGWRIVEERDGSDVVQRQYIDGRGIDEHLQLKDGLTGKVYYYHCNSQGFVGALTDTDGLPVELYEYSWLGKPTIIDATNLNQTLTASKVGNSYFFQGRQLDSETATTNSPGLYYYRNRYYSPETGEFLTIDPLGYWNHGQGNGLSAFGEDGWNNSDPKGLVRPRLQIERMALVGSAIKKYSSKAGAVKSYIGSQNIDGVSTKNKELLDSSIIDIDWLKSYRPKRHRLVTVARSASQKEAFRVAIYSGIGAGNKNQAAAHTERIAAGLFWFDRPDDELIMVGREIPCNSCQGMLTVLLNEASAYGGQNSCNPSVIKYYSYLHDKNVTHSHWTTWVFEGSNQEWTSQQSTAAEVAEILEILDNSSQTSGGIPVIDVSGGSLGGGDSDDDGDGGSDDD